MAFCIKCGDDYNNKRKALGYTTCLGCGSPKIKFAVMPITKSNYIIASSLEELRDNSYAAKGPR
jgi:ribosomal protein L37AE/L43A